MSAAPGRRVTTPTPAAGAGMTRPTAQGMRKLSATLSHHTLWRGRRRGQRFPPPGASIPEEIRSGWVFSDGNQPPVLFMCRKMTGLAFKSKSWPSGFILIASTMAALKRTGSAG